MGQNMCPVLRYVTVVELSQINRIYLSTVLQLLNLQLLKLLGLEVEVNSNLIWLLSVVQQPNAGDGPCCSV